MVIIPNTAGKRHAAQLVADIPVWMYVNSTDDRLTISQLGSEYRSNRVLSVR
jgi:hypothetical protein